MKLIYAGISSTTSLDHSNFLFNCKRNPQCQREYYIPIRSVTDASFYVDLPGKPDLIQAEVMDMCDLTCLEGPGGDFSDDFNEDFDIGGQNCIFTANPLVWNDFVVGQTPGGSWYGVFGSPTAIPDLSCFFYRFYFTIGGVVYVYYSEMFCIENCAPLAFLRGCYPNETIGVDAYDCNGIYYGFPTNADSLGQPNYRYTHWAYVRNGAIIDREAKLVLAYFNSKKNYKSVLTREKLFEFELIPSFYKDVLLGIFTRGNVEINGGKYRLVADQTWSIADNDSKLWAMDTNLTEECKQYFGCKPTSCDPPPLLCADGPSGITPSRVDGDYYFDFTGGTFAAGDQIEYSVLLHSDGSVVQSGIIVTPPIQFIIYQFDHPDFDPATLCYDIKWRKRCANGIYTPYTTIPHGNCIPVLPGVCKTYQLQLGSDSPTGATVTYKDCSNADATIDLVPGDIKYICALEGTVSTAFPAVTIVLYADDCSLPPVCHSYTVNYEGTGGGTTMYWEDCGSGDPLSTFFAFSFTVCSRSIPTADGPVEIIDNGPC